MRIETILSLEWDVFCEMLNIIKCQPKFKERIGFTRRSGYCHGIPELKILSAQAFQLIFFIF